MLYMLCIEKRVESTTVWYYMDNVKKGKAMMHSTILTNNTPLLYEIYIVLDLLPGFARVPVLKTKSNNLIKSLILLFLFPPLSLHLSYLSLSFTTSRLPYIIDEDTTISIHQCAQKARDYY